MPLPVVRISLMTHACHELISTARIVRIGLMIGLAGCYFSAGSVRTWGAPDSGSADIDYPLAVFNYSSLQRLRDGADFLFQTADQQSRAEGIDPWIKSVLHDLNGIDRHRPFGIMIYQQSGLIGTPVAIAYVPVTHRTDALDTLAFHNGLIDPSDGLAERHSIRFGERFHIRTRFRGDYLFLVGPDGDDDVLERNFPDPSRLSARQSSQHDLSIALLLKFLPPGLKTLFVEFFKNQSMAEFQQRDGESESAYRLRRASGESWLDLFEKVVNQGEELSIGSRIDSVRRRILLDLEIIGTPGSKLIVLLQSLVGKRTHFFNLLQNPAALTMSVSWLIDSKQRGLTNQFLNTAEKDFSDMAERGGLSGMTQRIGPIFKSLQATAETGHFDAFLQCTGDESGGLAWVGGVKLLSNRSLPTQMTEMLQWAEDRLNEHHAIENIELSIDAINSYPIHRLQGGQIDNWLWPTFAKSPYLFFHVTPQVVWFALGRDSAVEILKNAITQTAMPQHPQKNGDRIPFQVSAHATHWIDFASDPLLDKFGFSRPALALFHSENDSIRVQVRPKNNGMSLAVELEEGFIELWGRHISRLMDDGAIRRPRSEPRAPQIDPTAEDGEK